MRNAHGTIYVGIDVSKDKLSVAIAGGERGDGPVFGSGVMAREEGVLAVQADFMAAYSFACRLKTLSGLTPYEYICKIWTSEPERFIVNPIHQMPGLNTLCG